MFTSSQRMQAVQAPIIPTVAEWTRNNPGTISLGQGVVSYSPPQAAFNRISHFAEHPEFQLYGPAQGLPDLLTLIEKKLFLENAIDCNKGYKIVVTAGANMAFLNALLAIADPGDEVILPLPYYFNHEMAVRMVNCQPVAVATDAAYQLDINAIRQAITTKTRAIVTVSPNNPTGAVYPDAALQAINQLCAEHKLYHISDEAYENFIFDNARHVSPGSFANANKHTISLFSLSKAYGFASWRVGYMLVPEALYASILKVQDTNLICPPGISQHAAIGALETGVDYCRHYLQKIMVTRAVMLEQLQATTDICQLVATQGAFYFFIKINTKIDALDLTYKLITDFKVAAIPGSAFGLSTGCYLRISYGALNRQTAEEGMQRLRTGLNSLC